MRVSGDPYLQHCVETAVLLAKIGANATVVAAGLLHDTVDDSFMTHDYILREFGGGIADLVEGVGPSLADLLFSRFYKKSRTWKNSCVFCSSVLLFLPFCCAATECYS